MISMQQVGTTSTPSRSRSADWLAQAMVLVAGSAVGAIVAFVAAVFFGLIPFQC